MIPSAQPSSAPSKVNEIWLVFIDRLDDYFDIPSEISKPQLWNLLYYCNNQKWAVAAASGNCTLRLAILYCMYRFPWTRQFTGLDRVQSCTIQYPRNKVVTFSQSFSFDALMQFDMLMRHQETRGILNITIDFNGCILASSHNLYFKFANYSLAISFLNSRFVTPPTKPVELHLGDLRSLSLSNLFFTGFSVILRNIDQVNIINSVFKNFSLSIGNLSVPSIGNHPDVDASYFDCLNFPVPRVKSTHSLELRLLRSVQIRNCTFLENFHSYHGASILGSEIENLVRISFALYI